MVYISIAALNHGSTRCGRSICILIKRTGHTLVSEWDLEGIGTAVRDMCKGEMVYLSELMCALVA